MKRSGLSELATAVADGEAIDWSQDLTEVPERQRAVLALLEQISRTHTGGESVGLEAGSIERWGPLMIEEQIGAGGFGNIYRAVDPLLQRRVALKLGRSEIEGATVELWLQEARRLARIRHPNVVAVFGAERFDGVGGIWTELLVGRSIHQIVTEDGIMEAGAAAEVGAQVCQALTAVHDAGLIHGDVKPANIFREAGGRIVLLDFGSSLERDVTRASFGSPALLPPEALRGARPTTAIDIHCLGVSLYFMVSGKYPIDAEGARSAQAVYESNNVVSLRQRRPDLPEAFLDCVGRAMEADPTKRFASAAAFGAALRQLSRRPKRRARWLGAAAAGLTIAVLGAWFAREWLPQDGQLLRATQLEALATGSTPRVLASGAAVRVGDRLQLRLRPARDVSVYVLNADSLGNTYVLFPLPGIAPENPLTGGREYLLPGRRGGESLSWQVTSAGEQERFAIIASARPLVALENEISSWARAGKDSASATAVPFRGVGGLAADPGGAAGSGGVLDRVLAGLSALPGVEVEMLVLANP